MKPETRIDTTYPGWYRALRAVESYWQSWECIGWYRTREEAELALKLAR